MEVNKFEKWLNEALIKHKNLTDSVCTIIENLLVSNNIEYLAVSGRTKDRKSALEKIRRKSYSDPAKQMTDLSGVRVILYIESDIKKVSKIIEESFRVDANNSLNQDNLLSTNQIGYRSVHYVCDLGPARGGLPEFEGLSNLKFEFQIRTILQHAWAELAHDRKYKFTGKLPKEIERSLYLHAGILEIADKGFDEISNQIDNYIESIRYKSESGDLSTEINSLSLKEFIESWSVSNSISIEIFDEGMEELLAELSQFGIKTLSELQEIIPDDYIQHLRSQKHDRTIYGIVRDWMLLNDWRKFHSDVEYNWTMMGEDLFKYYFDEAEYSEFIQAFPVDKSEEYNYDDDIPF